MNRVAALPVLGEEHTLLSQNAHSTESRPFSGFIKYLERINRGIFHVGGSEEALQYTERKKVRSPETRR